jgi:O-antigen ligase
MTADAVRNHPERKEKIVRFLLWGGFFAALAGLFQFFLQFIIGAKETLALWSQIIIPFLGRSFSQAVLENPSWMVNVSGLDLFRALAFFPDPHMLAYYLNLLSPFSLVFFLKSKKKIYLIMFTLMLLASFLTFSRGGYLGIIASFLVGVVFFTKKMSRRKAGWIYGSIFLALIIILSFQNPVSHRFYSSFNLSEGSNLGRLTAWKESAGVIANNPLGVGLGNYPLEVKPSADYREPIYSHNLYLDIAAETGIINALVFLALILYSFFSFYKKSRKDYLNLAGAMGIASFAIHSLFETPLFSVHILPLLLIIISLSLNLHENDN